MGNGFKQLLLAVGAAVIVGGAPNAFAQPANCGDVNNDGLITSADLSALAAGTISSQCATTNCADVNATGSVELGDQVVLSRFLAGGGTKAEPGRSQGEQNLLYKLCTGQGTPIACASTPGTALTGRFTSNVTIPGRALGCSDFYIKGRVTMANNSTLTILPGVVIHGIKNPADPAFFLITRGAHIKADGSTDPIILTSDQAPGSRGSSDWGGIIINGFGPENFVGAPSSEGLPPGGDAEYGGNNPNAFTSFMRFVRVEFAGVIVGEANELNVITQNALGRLSVMENLQAHHGADDCFEWFGGNVREKFLVATACGDDGLDWQIGYQGQPDPATTPLAAVQFALVADDGVSVGSDPDAHGIEADNSEFGFDLQPRCAPYFCNITAIGTAATGGPANTGDGARFRRGTAGRLENSILENWASNGIDFRDASTRTDIAPIVNTFNNAGGACVVSGGAVGDCGDVTTTGASSVAGPLTYPADAPVMCSAAGTLLDTRYMPAAAIAAPDDCHSFDSFFSAAPYVGAFGAPFGNWLGAKPCCPPGNPFAIIGGQRCWLSFDRN
jgi:hypothetical protein